MTKDTENNQFKKDQVRKKLNAELDTAIDNLAELLAMAEKVEQAEQMEAAAKKAIEDLKTDKSKI